MRLELREPCYALYNDLRHSSQNCPIDSLYCAGLRDYSVFKTILRNLLAGNENQCFSCLRFKLRTVFRLSVQLLHTIQRCPIEQVILEDQIETKGNYVWESQ